MPISRLSVEDLYKFLKVIQKGRPMEELVKQYAELRGTTVLVSKVKEDGTITFVLESGHKMNMTAELLRDAIAAMEPKREEVGSAAASTPLSDNGGEAPEPPEVPHTEPKAAEIKPTRKAKNK